MLTLNKAAVTGGLSCGKSSVCRFFKEFGAYVVSADEIVHQLLSPNTNLGRKVLDLLGPDIITDQKIDRSAIAKKVFNQPELLQSLEKILHPAVREELERQYQQVQASQSNPLFIAEIPLLFETGSDKYYDFTIAVLSDSEKCIERFQKTTGYGRDEYELRMARQLKPIEKAYKADYVIENNGTMDDLRLAVKNIWGLASEKVP